MRVLWSAVLAVVAAATLWSGVARAGEDLERAAPPAWVRPLVLDPAPTGEQEIAAFRLDLMEQQFRFDETGMNTFIRTRSTALSPQVLTALGSVAIAWNPSMQSVTIHGVNILRGEQVIDVLADQEFSVIRREQNLEAAILDGILTATLQLNGLRVGDTLEVAYSVRTKIPLMGAHAEFLTTGAAPAPVGRYYLRGTWPSDLDLRIRATDGWEAPAVRRRGRESEIEMDLRDLQPLLVPPDAPVRFHHVRQLMGSDYRDWGPVGAVFTPLYDQASALEADSPLRERIEEIRAAGGSQADQAAAALRLVQDEIRYLALAMGDGGLVPASADETWRRRLGDCKAKTVVLLALLRELGIPARAALVSTVDDSLDRRLPAFGLFDHVIVQAEIDGRVVWLDGTRIGDRAIADVPTPAYGWVLPLRGADSGLERIVDVPLTRPQRETALVFDASQGLYAAAPVTGEQVYAGDAAAALQAQMAVAPQAQRDAYMRALWSELVDDLTIEQVRSTYDADRNLLRLTMAGTAPLDWSSSGSRRLEMPVSRVSWSAGEPRPAGPYSDLPILTNHPWFTRFTTTVRLPDGGRGFSIAGQDIDEEQAGYRYQRRTTLENGAAITVRESRSLRPEMTVAEQAAAKEPLARIGQLRAEVVAPSDYEISADDLDALEADTADTPEELLTRGLALNANGLPDQAVAAFDRAIEIRPDYALAWSNRGIVRFWRGDLDAARADFDQAARLDPSDRVAMNGHGLVALQEGRFDEAILQFSRALRELPDDVFALNMRATSYLAARRFEEALADSRRVRAQRPDDPQMAFREAAILIEMDRDAEASALIDDVVARQPANVETLSMLAALKAEIGDQAAAEAAYDAALALEADDPNLLIGRGEARWRQGRADEARADFARVRAASAGNALMLNNLCWAQATAGADPEQALADCDAAVAAAPGRASIQDSRGRALLQLGRAAEALEAYDLALEAAPELWVSLYGRGLARKALGQTEAGQADIDAALAGDPDAGADFEAYVPPAA